MKRSLLVAALSLALSSEVFAQEGAAAPPPPPPSSTPGPVPPPAVAAEHRTKLISVQPIAWIFGVYGIGFEVAITNRLSFVSGLNFYAFSFMTSQSQAAGGPTTFSTSTTVNVLGGLVQPGIAWFLVGRAPTGLWLSPKVEFGYISVGTSSNFNNGTFMNASSTTTSGFVLGMQGMVGYTHAFDIGLAIQLGVGLGWNYTPLSSSSSSTSTGGPVVTQPGTPFSFLGSFGRVSVGIGWNF